MENIEIRTITTVQDYKKLMFFNMFRKKRVMEILMPVATIISLAAVIGKSTGKIAMSDWYYYVCLAFLALLVLIVLVYNTNIKKFIASDKLIINSERKVTISESAIRQEGDKGKASGEFPWDTIYLAFETKQYFYLYINTMQAIILPKRDLEDSQIAAVQTLIKEKLNKRFHKR